MPLRTSWLVLSLAVSLTTLTGCGGGSTCATGTVSCGGACFNPAINNLHCGACGNACGDGLSCVAGACTPLCQPTALDLDTRLPATLPTWMARVTGQQAPTGLWGTLPAPRPTNTAWQRLVVGDGSGPVDFLPYQLKTMDAGLAVAHAAPVASSTDVRVPDLTQLVLKAYPGSFTAHSATGYDLLSVTMEYRMTGGTMTAPLVQGMPYVTVDYAGIKPFLEIGSDSTGPRTFTGVSVDGAPAGSQLTGSRFKLGLSDGSSWVLYASSPITFNWNAASLASRDPFTGWLRLAHYTTPEGLAVLDAHAGVVPRGGTLDVSVNCDVATLRFAFTPPPTGPETLLMAALPHHLNRMEAPASTAAAALTFGSLRGTLTGVEGSTWSMILPLSTIGWNAPRPVNPTRVAAVKAALAIDAGYLPPAGAVDADPYFGGKYLAKLARLALIADELGETATAATLRARLEPLVAAWLTGRNGNPLVYDTTWGGVVTTRSLASPGADFGQGHYNDHHFHYGYHLFAAAALAKADPAFYARHQDALLALVRDIANPSGNDPEFPRFRSMDFFRGHSWASGLTNYPDLPDQESTSEAVNAWYGLRLLGLASGDTRLGNIGRLLLALELDSARTYWQIPATSTIYPAVFAQNRCVGRLSGTWANFGTWFSDGTGTDTFKVYGIQMLPFTPMSEALLSPAWVADAWPLMGPAADAAGVWAGWKMLLHMGHAAAVGDAAWSEVAPLTDVEDGNSRTNALWWVATRP